MCTGPPKPGGPNLIKELEMRRSAGRPSYRAFNKRSRKTHRKNRVTVYRGGIRL